MEYHWDMNCKCSNGGFIGISLMVIGILTINVWDSVARGSPPNSATKRFVWGSGKNLDTDQEGCHDKRHPKKNCVIEKMRMVYSIM